MNLLKKLSISGIILAIFLSGCSKKAENAPLSPVSETEFVLNTVSTISIYGYEEEEAEKIINGAFQVCRDYDKLLSRTAEGSDVWNINHSGGKPVQVSEDTIYLLELSKEYGDLSGGAFDVTLGKLSEMWDFSGENPSVPPAEDIAEALSHTGYEKIVISPEGVYLTDPEAHVDLGGIAKGYTADKVKEYLVGEGVESGIINLGGNVLAFGGKPSENGEILPFQIGVSEPSDKQNAGIMGFFTAKDASVVTSGNYERYFEENGVKYHHILDSQTGYPAEKGLDSVTIYSEKSVDGDALSTACFCLGPDDAMKLIEAIPDTEAVFITSDGETLMTAGAEEVYTEK